MVFLASLSYISHLIVTNTKRPKTNTGEKAAISISYAEKTDVHIEKNEVRLVSIMLHKN